MRLDPALHHPSRVAIVTRLLPSEHVRFAKLQELTGLTSGNLASHLEALERAGYVAQRDAIVQLRPGKLVAMTEKGREAFRAYVEQVEALLAELKAADIKRTP